MHGASILIDPFVPSTNGLTNSVFGKLTNSAKSVVGLVGTFKFVPSDEGTNE